MPDWAEYLLTLLTSVAASGFLSAALIWLAKNWITERLRTAISHEYSIKLESHKHFLKIEQDLALEKLKNENARLTAMLSSASSAFSSAQGAAHQERLNAIKVLWENVLKLQKTLHPIATVSDLFGESSFRSQMLSDDGLKRREALMANPSDRVGFEEKFEVEKLRPFLGEDLFQLFHVYWLVPGRIVGDVLTEHTLGTHRYEFWMTFPDVQRILNDLLTADELVELGKAVMKLSYLRSRIELKMLAVIATLISGTEASASAFKNTKEIAELLQVAEQKLPAQP